VYVLATSTTLTKARSGMLVEGDQEKLVLLHLHRLVDVRLRLAAQGWR
jgi:hypothetical protein